MSKFNIIGLNYVSLYPADHAAALAYYAQIFGPLDLDDPDDGTWGWQMGSTWLTVFPGKFGTNPASNPQNVEFCNGQRLIATTKHTKDTKFLLFSLRISVSSLRESLCNYSLTPTQNVEFAIQIATPDEVDRLYAAFVKAGIKASQPPIDTVMYEPMRYAYVDDLFGVRIDIYCPTKAA